MRPYRGNGRPEAAYVIERMVDLAADELGIDPVELRRRNMIPPDAMPFKTGADLHLRLRRVREEHGHGARAWPTTRASRRGAPRRASAASCAASASPTRSSARRRAGIEGAEMRFDRGGTVTSFSGASTQGQGHETVFKQIVCDRLGIAPDEMHYVQGDTDQVVHRRRHRRLALGGARRLGGHHGAPRRSSPRRKRIAAHLLEVDAETSTSPTASSRVAAHQPHPDDQGGRARAAQPDEAADGDGARPRSPARSSRRRRRTSRTAATSARSRSTRKPARSRSCATAWSTTSAP